MRADVFLTSLIRVFQQFLRLLPERLSWQTGKSLGRLACRVLKERRRVALANVARIDPTLSGTEARAIVERCFEKLGTDFIEVLLMPFLKEPDYPVRFRMEDQRYMVDALQKGRGVLALVFHYGNWEIMGVASRLTGHEVVALARPLKNNKRLDAALNNLRRATGLTVIPNRDTAKDVMRHLKENRIVALLGDQREKRSRGVWVELFGEKVPTSRGIAAIAMKTGAPVVPVFMVRNGFLRHSIVCKPPLKIEREGAPIEELIYRNARKINALLEELVRRDPSEWLLVHRRFGRNT